LEDKINRFSNQSDSVESKYSKDIEKLDELVKALNKALDTKITSTTNIE
jgi:chaperonin cofactor prefoldin